MGPPAYVTILSIPEVSGSEMCIYNEFYLVHMGEDSEM